MKVGAILVYTVILYITADILMHSLLFTVSVVAFFGRWGGFLEEYVLTFYGLFAHISQLQYLVLLLLSSVTG